MNQEIFGELLEDPGESDFVIYGCAVNLMGLYSNSPIKCSWSDKSDAWLDEDGIFSVAKLGLNTEQGRVTYASTQKKDVEIWILGVRATSFMLQNWATFDCLKCGKQVTEAGNNYCIFCNTTKKHGEIILKIKEEPDDNSIKK